MDKEILIQEAIARDCTGSGGIFSPNANAFAWESDVIYVRPNLYSTEFEIKTSLSDYKNDAKKVQKHDVLKDRLATNKPNRFFYVLPKGLNQAVPEYAGLVEYEIVEETVLISKTKKAPLLHKETMTAQRLYQMFGSLSYRFASIRRKYYLIRDQELSKSWQYSQLMREIVSEADRRIKKGEYAYTVIEQAFQKFEKQRLYKI